MEQIPMQWLDSVLNRLKSEETFPKASRTPTGASKR